MSGGHFEYKQYEINGIAEEIETLIQNNNKPDEWGYSANFTRETLDKFAEAIKHVRLASAMVHRIDWLVSGDDGEDSFHKRWDEEMPPLTSSSIKKRKR